MNATEEKSPSEGASAGRSQQHRDASWRGGALAAGVSTGIVAYAIVGALLAGRTDLSGAARLWLAAIPIDMAGVAGVMCVLLSRVPAGRRLEALRLHPLRNAGDTLRRAGGHMLWLYPVTILLTGLTVGMLEALGYEPVGSPILTVLREDAGFATWLSLAVLAIVIAPLAEEILFRAVLFDALAARFSGHSSRTAAAIAFALFHMIPEQIPALFLLGLFLQRLRNREGTLWACVLFHALFNALSIGWLAVWIARTNGAGA